MAETNPSSILATAQTIFGDGFSVQNFHGGQHVDEKRLAEYYKTGGAHSTTGVCINNASIIFFGKLSTQTVFTLCCVCCLCLDSVRDQRDCAGGAKQCGRVACGLR